MESHHVQNGIGPNRHLQNGHVQNGHLQNGHAQNGHMGNGNPVRAFQDDDTNKPLKSFDLTGGVYVVTGGARGLGLSLAEGIAEAGGTVYCLDCLPQADAAFENARQKIPTSWGGSLHYAQVDVCDTDNLDTVITRIADRHKRLDGLVAAAGIQHLCPSVEYKAYDAQRMLNTNTIGVFMSATACARQMQKYVPEGNYSPSIVLIASMSSIVANKGLVCPMYNASKAAVVQLARNMAMEWGKPSSATGCPGIRVNCISPGHIITPMVLKNFKEVPGLKEIWEKESMLGRLSSPEEYRGAAVFLLSRASSFMTAANLVIDAGHTAW